MSSLISGAKNFAGEGLKTILAIPDRYEKGSWQQKALYIIFDLGFILVGAGGAAALMTFGGGLGFSSIMGVFLGAGVCACGLSWLMADVIPQKCHPGMRKVLAVALPILLVVASGALMVSGGFGVGLHGLTFSLANCMSSQFFYVGFLMMMFFSFRAVQHACNAQDNGIPFIYRERPTR